MRGCCTQRALRCAGGEAGGDSAGRGMSRSGRGGPVTWAAPPPRAAAGPRWAGPRGEGPAGGGARPAARPRQRRRWTAGTCPGPRSPGRPLQRAPAEAGWLRGGEAAPRLGPEQQRQAGARWRRGRSEPATLPRTARRRSPDRGALCCSEGFGPRSRLVARRCQAAPAGGTGGIVPLPCATPPCLRWKGICAAASPGCAGKGPGHKGTRHKECSFCHLGRAAQTVGRNTVGRAEGALKDEKMTYRKTRKDSSPDSVLLFHTGQDTASGTGQQTQSILSLAHPSGQEDSQS